MSMKNITVSHLLGEIAWLYTQSPLHRGLPMLTLDIVAMPALLKEQLWIFRDGDQPIGAAFWAFCNETVEAKLQDGPLQTQSPLTLDDWQSGDKIWLVDLLAPFANAENNQIQLMISDLAAAPLAGKEFHFHQTDPNTGKKEAVTIPADMGQRLKEAVNSQ